MAEHPRDDPEAREAHRKDERARFHSKRALALSTQAPGEGGLAYASRALAGGRAALIELARLSGHDRVRAVVAEWDGLGINKRAHTRLEALCEACELTPAEFLGAVVEAAFAHNTDVSKLLLAVSTPRIVQKSVRHALTNAGFRDRQMLLEAAHIVPKGGGINVSAQAVAAAKSSAATLTAAPPTGLPRFEEDTRMIVDAVRAED